MGIALSHALAASLYPVSLPWTTPPLPGCDIMVETVSSGLFAWLDPCSFEHGLLSSEQAVNGEFFARKV